MRARLPELIAAATLVEFELELALAVPAGTPYRALVALLLAVLALAPSSGGARR